MLIRVLNAYHVPMDKVIGICSDGASTMQGIHKGVCTQLAKHIRQLRQVYMLDIMARDNTRDINSFHDSRGIFVVHCVCHRLALVLTDAIKGSRSCAKVIPNNVIDLMTMLYEYFSRSPPRKKAIREFINVENEANRQARLRVQAEHRRPAPVRDQRNPVDELERVMALLEERHKLPRKIILTRWLSCAEAVRVILQSRDVYTVFFNNETTDKAQEILDLLEDSSVMAWYACMQDVLPVLTGLNILFQSSLPQPHLLYSKIQTAKATLINMVGRGEVRTNMIPLASITINTSFGAFTNKFIRDHSGEAPITGTGTRLHPEHVLQLKRSFYKLYAHCLKQIDSRFPPENMECFKQMQVIDPSVVHGPLRRHQVGTDDLAVIVGKLLHTFEVPLHVSGFSSKEEINNCFTIFRASEECSDLWRDMNHGDEDSNLIYAYYKQLLQQIPHLKPWAMFALFLLVFPTGNSISERGFSAMGAAHSKQRSEMGPNQVFAHLMIGFNGPSVTEFAQVLDIESRQPNWPLYIPPTNF